MTKDIQHIANSIWDALQAGRHMPAEWSGKLSLPQAYQVQHEILRRRVANGERHSGWKVGLTAAAMRAQQNVHEPCFGHLLQSGHKQDGHHYQRETLIQPGFENELCLTMGKTLKGPAVTFEDALAAVSHVAPALEVVEVRGPFAQDLALAIADNAQQHSYVTGEPRVFNADNQDLGQSALSLHLDGVEIEQAAGSNVMEKGGIASVVWLANKLAEFDVALEAGMHVMSGSFTKQYAIMKSTNVTAVYCPFGTVTARFI